MTSSEGGRETDAEARAQGGDGRPERRATLGAGPAGWGRVAAALGRPDPGRDRVPAAWAKVGAAIGAPAHAEPAGRAAGRPAPAGWAALRGALAGDAQAGDDQAGGDPAGGALAGDDPAGDDLAGDAATEQQAGEASEVDGTGAPKRPERPARVAGRRRRAVAVGAALAVVAGAVVTVVELTGGSSGLGSGQALSVNGKVVTVAAFDSQLHARETLYGITPPSQSDTAKYHSYLTDAAHAEAVSMLLDQLAPGQGVTVSTQAAETYLNQIVQTQDGGSQSAFATALGAAGLNETQVLDEVHQDLVYQQLFAKIVGTPTVTQAQISDYFDAHRAQLAIPETRDISHIVVSTQAAAQSLITQLKGGASFATLAAQSLDTATSSNGGKLGKYAKDDLQAAFATAAFAAPVGQPFGPVQEQSSYEVGEVTAVYPAAAASLTPTATGAIKTILTDQAQDDRWDAWLGGQLVKSHITYASAYRPAHPDQPPTIPLPTLTGETLAGVGAAAAPKSGTSTSNGAAAPTAGG